MIDFNEWRAAFRESIESQTSAAVPCDGCTACCRSSQFVHIAAVETETLARIPPALLFPAPRSPAGHFVLGYDHEGRCPMLNEQGCSIYEVRPRTCRTYDCRVFAAAGVTPDQPAVAEAVRRWHFAADTAAARAGLEAVRAEAAIAVRKGHSPLEAALGPLSRA